MSFILLTGVDVVRNFGACNRFSQYVHKYGDWTKACGNDFEFALEPVGQHKTATHVEEHVMQSKLQNKSLTS